MYVASCGVFIFSRVFLFLHSSLHLLIQAYRMFRVIMTGKNSSNAYWNLCCGGFELYGVLSMSCMCMCVCVPRCVCVCVSVSRCLGVCRPVCGLFFTHASHRHKSRYLSVYLCVCVCVCSRLSACVCVSLSLCVSVFLCLFVYLCLSLSLNLSVFLCVSQCVSVCLVLNSCVCLPMMCSCVSIQV